MRKIAALFLFIALTLAATGCAKQAVKERPPIKIAINQWAGYAHAFLAQEKGFFKKNGVNVELLFKKTTPDSMELFTSGEVSGCFDTIADIVLINSRGISAKVVCVLDYSGGGDVIIARPEIKSLSGLKDKTVSFEGVNTFSHLFVLKSLEKAALSEADLRFADINASGVLQALKDGRIDAGHTWEPTKSQALKEGYRILADAGDIPGIIIDVLAFNTEIIQERPDDIKRIIKSLFEARDYLKKDPVESIKIMARKMDMTEEEMKIGLEGIDQPDLKENLSLTTTTTTTTTIPSLYITAKMIIDFYLSRGQLSVIPEPGDIIEPKFIKELNAE